MKEFEFKKYCTLEDFDAWGPAVKRKEEILKAGKGDDFTYLISDLFDGIPDETEINDILAYENDLYEMLGMYEDEDFDESIRSKRRKPKMNESRGTHYRKFLN